MLHQRYLMLACITPLLLVSACKNNKVNPPSIDPLAPKLTEVSPAGIVYDDAPPAYTFSSSAAGSITYGGACSAQTTTAVAGNNAITFDVPDWNVLYSKCTITVTDADGRKSARLAVSPFRQIRRGSLNDTGLDWCADDSNNYNADKTTGCTALAGTHPGQDALYGRDAKPANNSNSDGDKGFSFTKLDTNGDELAADAVTWPCVRDNTTGLIWTSATITGKTQTDALALADAANDCGISDWQLPSRRELLSIVHYGQQQPAIDNNYFPATNNGSYWSRETYMAAANSAWSVDFADGRSLGAVVSATQSVRLVYRSANRALHNIEVPRTAGHEERRYPGWASGIVPGAGSGEHSYNVKVRLLPVTDQQALEFDVPPAIDPVTGTLSFTIKNKTIPDYGAGGDMVLIWSSAGLARVEVSVQDGKGAESAVHSFEIFADPTPKAVDVNIKHPWKAACIPVTMYGWDLDSDQTSQLYFPDLPWPAYRIIEYPLYGYVADYVSRSAGGAATSSEEVVSRPPNYDVNNMMSLMAPWAGHRAFGVTRCYVPLSSTFTGFDSFTYSMVDIDGNESAPVTVIIEIFEVKR